MESAWIPLTALKTEALSNNIAYLQSRNHELLPLFQRASFRESLVLQKQGSWIRCRTQTDPPIWVIGERDAGAEFARLQKAVAEKAAGSRLLILVGGAIGYSAAVLTPALLRDSQFRVVVVEPSADRVFAAFALVDFQAALATERLHFVVSDLSARSILEKLTPLNLWGREEAAVFCSPELHGRIDASSFCEQYKEFSQIVLEQKNWNLSQLSESKSEKGSIQRVLIVNCWRSAPGDAHMKAIEFFLKKRGIQTHSLYLNRHRFDAAGLEYQRQVEPKMLDCIRRFQPDWVLSYGYHAPQFVSRTVFDALPVKWTQVVTNVAYYDEAQYPGETAFLLDERMIPLFENRGYRNLRFAPLMADYVSREPAPTNRRFPVVFVGNSLGLSSAAADAFLNRWKGRESLMRYIHEAEGELSDFDRQSNLYDFLQDHPIPQVSTEKEKYDIFRYLLCQATAARRRAILEQIAPQGLTLFGGDWDAYLPQDSPLRACWKGVLPMQDEPKIFSHGSVFVNIQSVGHVTGPNMRFFNVAGMGAFQISDAPQFDGYLSSGSEIVYASSIREFGEKIRYFLDRPAEMDAIRERAHERVTREWTYDHWLNRVLGFIEQEG